MKKLLTVFLVIASLLTMSWFAYGANQPQLETKSLLSNHLEILLPKGFTVMSEKMAALKYPKGNRPSLIYTNKSGSVNVAFNHTQSKLSNNDMPKFTEAMKKYLKSAQPAATWISDGVATVNKKNVGYLEMITPGLDTKIYNLMFFVELDNRALLITFNCTEEQMKTWQPVAKKIMNSIKTK